MLIKALIHKVQRSPHVKDGVNKGDKVEVSVLTEEPLVAYTMTFWSHDVAAGVHKPYESLVNKHVEMAVELDSFRDKVKLNPVTSVAPVEIQAPKQPAAKTA